MSDVPEVRRITPPGGPAEPQRIAVEAMPGRPGEEGPRGKEGPQGPRGPEGPKGPDGNRGPEGPQGPRGGGGAGGAGGWVQLVFRFLLGEVAPNAIDVTGGGGGLPGAGVGTGLPGKAGGCGAGGFVSQFNLETGEARFLAGNQGYAPGGTGQFPAEAQVTRMDL